MEKPSSDMEASRNRGKMTRMTSSWFHLSLSVGRSRKLNDIHLDLLGLFKNVAEIKSLKKELKDKNKLSTQKFVFKRNTVQI